MIVYEGVEKSYSGTPVIRGVSFQVSPGEVFALLGPNGSGKSTLLKMSIALVTPDKGRVALDGVEPSADPLTAKRLVGYLPEEPVLFESLRADEYVRFMMDIYGVDADWDTVGRLARELGLWEHGSKLVGELSHGNKRKLMLLVLMLREPQYLVLDEVFSGLDPISAARVKTWMRGEAARGRPVLFSTHILPVAEALADRIAIIYGGSIVATGTPAQLKKLYGAEELEEVFLSVTGHAAEYREMIEALRGRTHGDEENS